MIRVPLQRVNFKRNINQGEAEIKPMSFQRVFDFMGPLGPFSPMGALSKFGPMSSVRLPNLIGPPMNAMEGLINQMGSLGPIDREQSPISRVQNEMMRMQKMVMEPMRRMMNELMAPKPLKVDDDDIDNDIEDVRPINPFLIPGLIIPDSLKPLHTQRTPFQHHREPEQPKPIVDDDNYVKNHPKGIIYLKNHRDVRLIIEMCVLSIYQ